jgi:hypothetical protein
MRRISEDEQAYIEGQIRNRIPLQPVRSIERHLSPSRGRLVIEGIHPYLGHNIHLDLMENAMLKFLGHDTQSLE